MRKRRVTNKLPVPKRSTCGSLLFENQMMTRSSVVIVWQPFGTRVPNHSDHAPIMLRNGILPARNTRNTHTMAIKNTNTNKNTLKNTTAVVAPDTQPAPGIGDNARPLTEIMQDAIKLEEAAKAVPHMVRYCIMRLHETMTQEDEKAPTLQQYTLMKKGDKSKVLSLYSSALLGYANIEELKTAQAEAGTAVKPDDTMATVIEKESKLITVDQFDAARSRIGREIGNAAAMEALSITSASYSDLEQTFFIPTAMWLAPGMVAHGRLAMADTHPLDGKAAIVMINALPYEIKLGLDYLTFIGRIRALVNERKELPDSPLARMIAKANGLRYIGQPAEKTNGDNATPPDANGASPDANGVPPAGDTPPVTPQSDENGTVPRGPEEIPPAHALPHFRKLTADFISAAHLFVTECGKLSRPADMVTDDLNPHWKDFVNTLSHLSLMRDAILENTARVDAAHAAQVEANLRAAREKANEKASVSHTRAKSNKAVDKDKSAA